MDVYGGGTFRDNTGEYGGKRSFGTLGLVWLEHHHQDSSPVSDPVFPA